MKILDCYNSDSTLNSLSGIFSISAEDVLRFLDEVDEGELRIPNPFDLDKNLFSKIGARFNPRLAYDATCWYHFTVLPKSYKFDEGLKPFSQALPELLKWLGKLEDLEDHREWPQFRKGIIDGEIRPGTFRERWDSNYQQGPFGNLVRDFAFHATSKRDYFRKLPESVEDIVSAIKYRFGVDLTSGYLSNSSSYIVKFITDDTPIEYLHTALFYLFCIVRNRGLCAYCNTNFTMNGKAVPPENIIQVEEYSEPPSLIYAT